MEQLFEEARYVIRYEKGNFNSGYCIIEDRKVAVINKFLSVEGRINVLVEILPTIEVIKEELSGEMLKWYEDLMKGITRKDENSSDNSQSKIDL